MAHNHDVLTWILFFFGITLMSTNWAIVADILLYVVMPNRRAMAQAIQILISHLFGDASSPFIVGAVGKYINVKYFIVICFY